MIKDVEGYKSCQHLFLLYRKREVSYKVKNAPRGCASRGEEAPLERERIASDSVFLNKIRLSKDLSFKFLS